MLQKLILEDCPVKILIAPDFAKLVYNIWKRSGLTIDQMIDRNDYDAACINHILQHNRARSPETILYVAHVEVPEGLRRKGKLVEMINLLRSRYAVTLEFDYLICSVQDQAIRHLSDRLEFDRLVGAKYRGTWLRRME